MGLIRSSGHVDCVSSLSPEEPAVLPDHECTPVSENDQFFRAKLSAVDGYVPGRFEAKVTRT